jgi:hypothetical protein
LTTRASAYPQSSASAGARSQPGTSDSSRRSAFSAAADSLDADLSVINADSLLDRLKRLWIKTKDQREVQFAPNAVQRDIAARSFDNRKLLVLKARQVGVSTFSQAWAYTKTTSERFTNAVTISHDAGATTRLHAMQKFFMSRDTPRPATTYNRIGAVTYASTESTHYIGTAGNKAFGRGDTLHFIHCSELAFWDHADTLLTGLLEALTPEGKVIIESTPNGQGGHFYELWQGAPENGWTPLFYPWWWEPAYRLQGVELGPLSDDEQQLVAAHSLDLEQIAWRREKQRELRDKFPQEYPENPIDCFLVSGRPYFAAAGLRLQERWISEPGFDDQGLAIWQQPEEGHRYVIGADVAEGLEGGDWSVAQVVDVETGEQVARMRGHWPTAHYARILALLGYRFNIALIAPERNNHGHAVLDTLRDGLQYPNIYRHFEYDPLMDTELKHRWGYPTTPVTKPVMMADLDAALSEGGLRIHDRTTLSELRTFHWNGKGGMEAIEGCFDDTVVALAIAHQVRKQPGSYSTAMGYFEQRNADTEHQKLVDEFMAEIDGPLVDEYLKSLEPPKEGN